jgi:CDP-glycerol glycerophosphotransferase
MKKQAPEYRYVWLGKDLSQGIEGAKVVRYNSFAALYHLATARLWVDNARKREWIHKRKGQYYVQTWHGSVGIKKGEAATIDKLSPKYIMCAKHDSKMADLVISGTRWATDFFRRYYWYEGDILELGQPKADIFYRDFSEIRERVFKQLGFLAEEHFILYAPTFRNDGALDCYDIDYDALIASAEKKWGGRWYALVRLHPNIQDDQNAVRYTERVRNGTAYDEINDLIISCDMLITDYSSCAFDAMEAGKNVVLYAVDREKYMDERGVWFQLEELPFPLSCSNQELAEVISLFDEEVYHRDVAAFMKQLGFFNHATASKECAAYILKQLKKI